LNRGEQKIADTKISRHIFESLNVIDVRMRRRDVIDARIAEFPQIFRHDHFADPRNVRFESILAVAQINASAAVNEHRFAVRKYYECRVALADIKESDVKVSVGLRRGERMKHEH